MFTILKQKLGIGRRAALEARLSGLESANRKLACEVGLWRERAGWDVAQPGRLTSKLHGKAMPGTAASLWNLDGATLNRIGRYLIRNHPVADAAFDYLNGKILGAKGILPRFNTGDRRRDLYLRDAFRAWAEQCDQRGEDGLNALQEIWLRELGATGEAFVTWGILDGQLKLSLFEAEQLSGLGGSTTGLEQWAGGIVYDQYGRKLRYEVQRASAAWSTSLDTLSLPAERVAHIYRRERPTQWRGVSPFGATGQHLWMTGDIDAAELATQQSAAYWGIVLQQRDTLDLPPSDPEAVAAGLESETAPADQKTREDELIFEIGAVRQMPTGTEAKLLETNRPNSNYQAFSTTILKAISASLGVPYAAATGDTGQANYSSMRGDEMNVRPRLRRVQHLIIARGMTPVTRAWATWALLSGEVRYRGLDTPEMILDGLRWQLPGWEWVDPGAEAKQEESQLRSGRKTWLDAVEEGGRDPEDVLEDLTRIQAWNAEHGLNLPLPDLTAGAGAAPEPEAGEEEEPETDGETTDEEATE